MSAGRQQRFFIEKCHAFEPPLEKKSPRVFLLVGQPGKRFFQALHKPTETLEPLAGLGDPRGILESPLDPVIGNRFRLPSFVAWRKEPPPAPDDLCAGPPRRHLGIEPRQHM
jgi:hypothetical protein